MNHQDEAQAMRASVEQAQTLAQLDDCYREIIGYSIVEDDPSQTAETVRALLVGFIDEFCASCGISYSEFSK